MGLITRAKLLNAIARLEKAGVSVDRVALSRIAAEAESLRLLDFKGAAELARRLEKITGVDEIGRTRRGLLAQLHVAKATPKPTLSLRQLINWNKAGYYEVTLPKTHATDFRVFTKRGMKKGEVHIAYGEWPQRQKRYLRDVEITISGRGEGIIHIDWQPFGSKSGLVGRLVVRKLDSEGTVLYRKSVRVGERSVLPIRIADDEFIFLKFAERAAPASTQGVTPRAPK